MFFFNRLVVKIIFFFIVLFALSIGIYLTLFIQSQIRREETAILNNGVIFAELSAPLFYQDYLTASARGFPRFSDIARERLGRSSDILQVMLLATNGKIIFDTNDFALGIASGRTAVSNERFIEDKETLRLIRESDEQTRSIVKNNEHLTEIIIPIGEVGGGHVFSMRYILSYRSLENHKLEIYREALITFLPLFLLTVGAGIILAFSITKPIKNLYRATEKIQQGDFTIQLPVHSHDEIGKLTDGFNQMVSALKESQGKLQEANKLLGSQVANRTTELQLKVNELERINKLMVGRELKMAELKKENELLKTKVTS